MGAIFYIGTVFVAFLAAAASPPGAGSPADTSANPTPLKLKVKPDCTQDSMLNEALQWSRTDLKVVLRVGISKSGTVDTVSLVKFLPADDELARRWADSLVRCWSSAVYDTTGADKTSFPV